MIYLELFISYLKIGFFGFGGGYSMLSLIHNEVVVQHEWISNAALSDIIAISQMTPGPIAINSATYIGYTVAGFWGSIIATVAVALPSLTIMVLITRFFLQLKGNPYMERVMAALKPAVIAMIISAALMLLLPSSDGTTANMIDGWSWVLYVVAFGAALKKVNPIKLIIASAVAGIAIYYLPTLLKEAPSPQVERFDFAQIEEVDSPEFEQEWVNYLYLLQQIEPLEAAASIRQTLEDAAHDTSRVEQLLWLGEKYLYNPNSPLRSDELLIPILEFVAQLPTLNEQAKIRPRALLQRALLNRVGTIAADVEFTREDGSKGSIHEASSERIILYFNNPDCPDCRRVSTIIEQSEVLKNLINCENLIILPIFAESSPSLGELYNLKAIPTLYLLDKDKRVILKDVAIETIINNLALRQTE